MLQETVPGKSPDIENKEAGQQSANVPEFTADHEKKLTEQVAHHAGKMLKSPVSTETLIPPGAQSIHSNELEEVGAVSPDKEPDLRKDAEHFVETIPAIFGQIDPDTYNRGVSGPKVVSMVKSFMKKKAA